MNSFEQKIKERNNLLKSQVESLTGRSPIREVVETLLKAGVAEEDMVEKAKYVRREGAPGNYKYVYEEPKGKSGKKEESSLDKQKIGNKISWLGADNKFHESEITGINIKAGTIDLKDSENGDGESMKNVLYKYITQPKENKTDKVDKKEGKNIKSKLASHYNVSEDNVSKLKLDGSDSNVDLSRAFKLPIDDTNFAGVKETIKKLMNKSESSDLEKADKEKKQKKIKKVMEEFKDGSLKSSSGEKVSNPKQAIAIAMSEAKVTKSELIDLIKGVGEGSKGGKVIGHTKSGKPIYEDHKHLSHKDFSEEDHKDAQKIHDDFVDDRRNADDYDRHKDTPKNRETSNRADAAQYHFSSALSLRRKREGK